MSRIYCTMRVMFNYQLFYERYYPYISRIIKIDFGFIWILSYIYILIHNYVQTFIILWLYYVVLKYEFNFIGLIQKETL